MARQTVRTVDGAEELFPFLQEQFQKSAGLWGPRRSHEHPLFVDAPRYATLVSEWFHAEESWFDGRHKALEVHELAGLPHANVMEAMLEIRAAAASIGLYQFDIADKLQRAVEALECPIADSRGST